MKKLILSAFGMAAMMASVNAQTYFSEDFSGGIGQFTTVDDDGDGNDWAIFDDAATFPGQGNVMTSASWDGSPLTPDNWLITNSIDLTSATGLINLEWKVRAQDQAWVSEEYDIYIATANTVTALTAAGSVYNETLIASTGYMSRTYNMSAFAGQTVFVAFRHHNSTDWFRMNLDDIVVKTPLNDDAEMTSLNIAPYITAGNVNVAGVITNNGANTITAMDIVWNDGSGPQTDNLTGLNIASGATYNFTHATPLAAVAGTSYALNVSVVLTGDGDAGNDALTANTAALTSIPAKTVVGEENTGTWCGWCPRGGVGLANMESESDFIGIAVHNGDPMTVTAYDAAASTYFPGFTGYPNGAIDRVLGGDPGAASFLSMHNTRKTTIVPCAVNSITANYDATTNMITVSTEAEFFGDITGNFRLSCIIIQDDLESTAAGWAQVNYYSGGGSGVMAFPAGINGGYDFSTGTDPVAPSLFGGYDHVARSLSSNDILGDAGSLPATTVNTGTYTHTFAGVDATAMPGAANAPFVKEDAHAVVMIVDANTGEILNAGKAAINGPVSVDNVNTTEFNLQVFPNPTNEVSTISFNLAESATVSMEVFNSVGSVVSVENAKTMTAGTQKITFNGTELPGGIYFVNLKVGEQIITKKVSLIK